MTADSFTYTCSVCGQPHVGLPTFAWDWPIEAVYVPVADWPARVVLTSETCVVDNSAYFLRGCVEIPIRGLAQPIVWGMWPRISGEQFRDYAAGLEARSLREGVTIPGKLGSVPPMYPDAEMEVLVHVRPIGVRPLIELLGDHPFAADQRVGITQEHAQSIAEQLLHPGGLRKRHWWQRG